MKRYDVGKLNYQDSTAVHYLGAVLDQFDNSWMDDGTLEEKWRVLRDTLASAAEDLLGISSCNQPDWFTDSLGHLQPLLTLHNEAYFKWVGTGAPADLIKFRKARGEARRAVRAAKNKWFQDKADIVEQDKFGGKQVWNCIRDMQHGKRGQVPSRVITIHDEDDMLCVSTASQHQQWRRHFAKVLNVASQHDERELDSVRQHEVDSSLADLPNEEDVQLALSQVGNGKAAGSSGILPETLKVGQESHEFMCMLLTLVRAVWREKCVPQDWRDTILVPVPKKAIFIAVTAGEVLLCLMLLVSWWAE